MILSVRGDMSEQTAQEPTMEEILASIRRIISEDDAPADEAAPEPVAEAAPAPAPEPEPEPVAAAPAPEPEPEEEILELTQKIEEPAASIGDLDVFEAPPAASFDEPEPAPPPRAAREPDEGLVSEPISAAVTSAFGQLQQRIGMPSSSTTLDGVVRELLRPLLKEWLDQHLRGIVEAKVEEEVERQARRLRS
jgi:cell pole-organizing protein PopZ